MPPARVHTHAIVKDERERERLRRIRLCGEAHAVQMEDHSSDL